MLLPGDIARTSVDQLLRRLDETNHPGIETVEALLALAGLDQGRTAPSTPVDLAELTADVVSDLTVWPVRPGSPSRPTWAKATSTASNPSSGNW